MRVKVSTIFVVVVSLFLDIEKMKQIFCLLLSLFAVTYAQKGRGIKVLKKSLLNRYGKKKCKLKQYFRFAC